MKILTGIDIPFMPFGGSPIICNDWYSDLPDDIQVRFLTLKPPPQFMNWWSIKDLVLLDVEKKKSIEEFPEYIEQLKQALKAQIEEYKPDVIHCQHLNFGFSRAISEISEYNIPKIAICHGTDVQQSIKSDFFLRNMQIIRSKMDLLIFPSQNMAHDYFKVDPAKIPYQIIPHGIPKAAFHKRASRLFDGVKQKRLRVLYAGRLNHFKGADIVVSAMRHVHTDIHLTVIGGEDELGYKDQILSDIQKNNLKNIVSLKDHLSRNQLWNKFDEFDLIVFPSTKLEAFSLTTIEAQARGLPVVFAEAGGIENAVGKSAIKVSPNTPESWAKSLNFIYQNPKLLGDYQKKGYENAKKHLLGNINPNLFDTTRKLLTDLA